MARRSDEDLRREPVDEWVEALKNRTVELQKEEKERNERQRPAIFRVDPSLRQLKKEHFETSTLPLGLVSKIERPVHAADTNTLKLDVTIKFLHDIGKTPDDWKNISESVVPDPVAVKRIYSEYCSLSLDSIQSILAQDAIFLACFLPWFLKLNRLPSNSWMLQETRQFFLRQSRRLCVLLFRDICKLENQIPLELVKNAIVIVFRCQGPNLLEKECQDKANEALEQICSKFVHRLGTTLPSCQFLTPQVTLPKAKQTELISNDAAKTATNTDAGKNTNDDSDAKHSPHVVDVPEKAQAKETDHPGFIQRVLKKFQIPSLRSLRKKTSLDDSQAAKTPATSTQAVPDPLHRCQHLLHCLAQVYWNEAKVNGRKNGNLSQSVWNQALPQATKLHKYGIELRGHKEFHPKFVGYSLWRRKATLFLPQIKALDDDTEELWRNLLAFEDAYMKQSEDERRSFVSYLQFMNDLISTEEDVQLLFEGRSPVIIKNSLEDHKAVAAMYKLLYKNHFLACNAEWSSVRREILAYYESRGMKGVAEFIQSNKKWHLKVGFLYVGAAITSLAVIFKMPYIIARY